MGSRVIFLCPCKKDVGKRPEKGEKTKVKSSKAKVVVFAFDFELWTLNFRLLSSSQARGRDADGPFRESSNRTSWRRCRRERGEPGRGRDESLHSSSPE